MNAAEVDVFLFLVSNMGENAGSFISHHATNNFFWSDPPCMVKTNFFQMPQL